jgi:uncharacterized phage-like protein YoqJ
MVVSGFGHRPDELGGYSKDVLAKLIAFAVETLPQFGPTKIISGMSLGWEQALAMAAIELDLPLIAALPFEGQEKVWPEKSQEFYRMLLKQATEVKVVSSGRYEALKFQDRDQWIIDNSEGLIVLWKNWETDGVVISELSESEFEILISKKRNTDHILRRTLEYAAQKDRHIYQLWSLWEEWQGDYQFETFRESMMDISLYEGRKEHYDGCNR